MNLGEWLLARCRKRKKFWGKLIRGCDADGDAETVYLERHFLIKIQKPRRKGEEESDTLFGVYLHCFHKSDTDRAPHDHPWWFATLILSGGYWENQPNGRFWRKPGAFAIRNARHIHWVELEKDEDSCVINGELRPCLVDRPAITLFIVGPQVRDWGFWLKEGWLQWEAAFKRWGC